MLLCSRSYSLTLTRHAIILFTTLLSTLLLRDATVFIFVDRPPRLLQESSSRPRVLLRLSSSLRPTYLRRRLPIFESIRAACRPRCHILFTNACLVRILVKSLVAAVISQVFQRPPQCASIADDHKNKAFFLRSLSVGRCFLPLCVLLSALPAEPSGLARSFFTQGKQFPNCQQNKLLVYA